MKTKRITALLLAGILTLSLCGCKKITVLVEEYSSSNDSEVSEATDNTESTDEKITTINIVDTITNSEYCNMEYTISYPGWEFEKDYGENLDTATKKVYTRMYKSDDVKLKFFVTEYCGTIKYPGRLNESFGENTRTEARGVTTYIENAVFELTGYSENYSILDNEPTIGNDGIEYYQFFLQLPNENSDYYYVKGYIATNIKHPIAVYFFDKTVDTVYNDEMESRSWDIIKSLTITNLEQDSQDEFDMGQD